MSWLERAVYLLSFEKAVDREAYFRHGIVLASVKYGVDAALVGAAAGLFWAPWSYLRPLPVAVSPQLGGPTWLAPTLALWTLPFLWIGVTLTMRRLLDAGRSAWWTLFFFVPWASYALFIYLVAAPSASAGSPAPDTPDAPLRPVRRASAVAVAAAAGTLLGVGMLYVGVATLESYGLALFMGTPFGVGTLTGFLRSRLRPATVGETHGVVSLTVLITGMVALSLGQEGAVCLAMMLPLGWLLALLGGQLGRAIALRGGGSVRGAALLVVALPGGAALEGHDAAPALREVVTAVEVDAPPEVVWESVVAFPPLERPTELLFRLGVAYPVEAVVDGRGVGALRRCVFSTGAFVEPITVWERGRRLAFDVVRSPPPLRELSFRTSAPPHLDGYLVPRRGEFRLVPLPGGRTRLEGSTWYEQRLRPEGYWVLFSDRIIGRIHRRVLEHVRDVAEAGPDPLTIS